MNIKQELAKNEEVRNMPDLVARVFRAKLESLEKEMFNKQIFGPIVAFVYVIKCHEMGN